MTSFRSMVDMVRSGSPSNFVTASLWTASSLLFGLMPMLLSMLGLAILKRFSADIGPLLWNGELLMVSNAIVGSASMFIGKDRSPNDRFFGRQFFIMSAVVLVAPTTFVFGAVRILDAIKFTDVNHLAVLVSSGILFVCGCLYSFFVVLIDESATSNRVDAEKKQKADEKKLEDELNRIDPPTESDMILTNDHEEKLAKQLEDM